MPINIKINMAPICSRNVMKAAIDAANKITATASRSLTKDRVCLSDRSGNIRLSQSEMDALTKSTAKIVNSDIEAAIDNTVKHNRKGGENHEV